MVDCKIAPVRKILSKKIRNEEGPSVRVFTLSKDLGMISEEEFDIITKLKKTQEIEASKETMMTLKILWKKRLIEKKKK
ncbi:MAG: hypothetical protein ACFFAS_01955 [Promethearchaeota archaeon]